MRRTNRQIAETGEVSSTTDADSNLRVMLSEVSGDTAEEAGAPAINVTDNSVTVESRANAALNSIGVEVWRKHRLSKLHYKAVLTGDRVNLVIHVEHFSAIKRQRYFIRFGKAGWQERARLMS